MPGRRYGSRQDYPGFDFDDSQAEEDVLIRPSPSGSGPRPSMSSDSLIVEASESQMQLVQLPTPDLRSIARPFRGGFRSSSVPCESDARNRGEELLDAMLAKKKETAAFQRLQRHSAKNVAVDAVPQQDSQSEQLSRTEKAKLAVQRLIDAESVAAESVVAESQKFERTPKKKNHSCVSHEKSRSQYLVRTGFTNRAFRYGGAAKNRYASECEAKKAALEFFEKRPLS